MNGEIKFWTWKCLKCGKERVFAIAGKLPSPCDAFYCGGTDFQKVGEGRTEDEARRDAQQKRHVNL